VPQRERGTEVRLFLSLRHGKCILSFPFEFYSEYIRRASRPFSALSLLLRRYQNPPPHPCTTSSGAPDARAYSIHACLPVRYTNLLTLAVPDILECHDAPGSFTRLVRGLVSSRVWLREVLPISNAHYPLSRCDVRHKSRFRFQFIMNRMSAHVGHGDLYFSPVSSPRICRINVPVRFSSHVDTEGDPRVSKQYLGLG